MSVLKIHWTYLLNDDNIYNFSKQVFGKVSFYNSKDCDLTSSADYRAPDHYALLCCRGTLVYGAIPLIFQTPIKSSYIILGLREEEVRDEAEVSK